MIRWVHFKTDGGNGDYPTLSNKDHGNYDAMTVMMVAVRTLTRGKPTTPLKPNPPTSLRQSSEDCLNCWEPTRPQPTPIYMRICCICKYICIWVLCLIQLFIIPTISHFICPYARAQNWAGSGSSVRRHHSSALAGPPPTSCELSLPIVSIVVQFWGTFWDPQYRIGSSKKGKSEHGL